ncbi:hypothetical protein PIB30_009278 [Stylosanthes scabra]|uniref:Generative cell specific-1/HAP2 domain-containing protein n=1 Tax=Stylosanthes scabra TaxID=79078 RepID=A0ABU6R691_9FABA|nr:hypothetical protein [Stylosanthes scabra]
MATVLDNGTQGMPFQPPETGMNGFFDSIEHMWTKLWTSFVDFVTGKSCRQKCSGFFDFKCHIQYVCLSWILMFGLFLAIFPAAIVVLWLLHEEGLFDPIYYWCDDSFVDDQIMDKQNYKFEKRHHHRQESRHPKHGSQHRQRTSYEPKHKQKHKHSEGSSVNFDQFHHVQKENHKHGRHKKDKGIMLHNVDNHGHKKDRDIMLHNVDNHAHHKRKRNRDTSIGLVKDELEESM